MNLVILTLVAPWHIILILVVVLIMFGGKKIPEFMRGLGEGIKEFKDGMNGPEQGKDKEKEKTNSEEDKPLLK
jgi:sec-independent protein translocase protein TatA